VAIRDRFNGLKFENIVYCVIGLEYYPSRRQYLEGKPDLKMLREYEIRKLTNGKVVVRPKKDSKITERYLIVGIVETRKVFGYIPIIEALEVAEQHPEFLDNPNNGSLAYFIPLHYFKVRPISDVIEEANKWLDQM
jgi:hypothetical protein